MRVPVFGLLAVLIYCAIGAATAAEVANFKILKLEGNNVRWQKASDGQGPVISYSIVSDAAEFVGARNCRKLASTFSTNTQPCMWSCFAKKTSRSKLRKPNLASNIRN